MNVKCADCPEAGVVKFPLFDKDVEPKPYCSKCLGIVKRKKMIELNDRLNKQNYGLDK